MRCLAWSAASLSSPRPFVELECREREIYMYDTFEYMPPPDDRDIHVRGYAAAEHFDPEGAKDHPVFCVPPPSTSVRSSVERHGTTLRERLHYVKGLVEETIPAQAPDRIATVSARYATGTARQRMRWSTSIRESSAAASSSSTTTASSSAPSGQRTSTWIDTESRRFSDRVDASCRLMVVPCTGGREPASTPTRSSPAASRRCRARRG